MVNLWLNLTYSAHILQKLYMSALPAKETPAGRQATLGDGKETPPAQQATSGNAKETPAGRQATDDLKIVEV